MLVEDYEFTVSLLLDDQPVVRSQPGLSQSDLLLARGLLTMPQVISSFSIFWKRGRVKAGGEGCSKMKAFEKQTYNSVEELMSSCASSELKSHVSFVLDNNQYVAWTLASCAVDGDTSRSEFTSHSKDSDLMFHMFCVINAAGVYSHISSSVPGQPGV